MSLKDLSFTERRELLSDEMKGYLEALQAPFKKYMRVQERVCRNYVGYYVGRKPICKIRILSKSMRVYLALDPASLPYKVYHHKDVGHHVSYKGTPTVLKVKGKVGLRKALRLIVPMVDDRTYII